MSAQPIIIYTKTDEAPALATYSLLPIVQAFTKHSGINVETRDISLASRVLAVFSELLPPAQRVADSLGELGALTLKPEANIIKLPNISASVPQLKEVIAELQAHGYAVPDYPEVPKTDAEKDAKSRYDKVKGSAVNPVLREGNSDRRAPKAVKDYARKHPHSMGKWAPDSKTTVSTMSENDFFSNEKSLTVAAATDVKIEFVAADGKVTVLKDKTPLKAGEILDGTVMRKAALMAFYEAQIARAKQRGVLFSVHLKATMMKVSDPIIFGCAVRSYFAAVFEQHGAALESAGVNANDGMAALLKAIEVLPDDERAGVQGAIEASYEQGPALAMVDSDRGIT